MSTRSELSTDCSEPESLRDAELHAARIAGERQRREARAAEREAWDKVRRWSAVVSALGGKLAAQPDTVPAEEKLARIFHAACERLHDAETAALVLNDRKGAL